MEYLTRLIELDKRRHEIEDKLNKWEIKDAIIAQYLIKDRKRTDEWLKEGSNIEEDIINSPLESSDKSYFLSRIDKSYKFIPKEDRLSQYLPYFISFSLGILSYHFFLQLEKYFKESLTEGICDGIKNV